MTWKEALEDAERKESERRDAMEARAAARAQERWRRQQRAAMLRAGFIIAVFLLVAVMMAGNAAKKEAPPLDTGSDQQTSETAQPAAPVDAGGAGRAEPVLEPAAARNAPETPTEAATAPPVTPAPTDPPETPEPLPAPAVKILESVPLDAETQAAIFEVCDGDPELFSTLMAMAGRESNFNTEAIGDHGHSYGMFQIYVAVQAARLEKYGYSSGDLLDPVNGARIAVDILKEIELVYRFKGESILIAYNAGPGTAAAWIREGITSTEYSRTVTETARQYLQEGRWPAC